MGIIAMPENLESWADFIWRHWCSYGQVHLEPGKTTTIPPIGLTLSTPNTRRFSLRTISQGHPKKFTNRIYIYRERKTYYTELTHMFIETEMSQDLQGVGKLETQESQRCKFQFEVQQAQEPVRAAISVQVWRQDKTFVLAQKIGQSGNRRARLLFYSGL